MTSIRDIWDQFIVEKGFKGFPSLSGTQADAPDQNDTGDHDDPPDQNDGDNLPDPTPPPPDTPPPGTTPPPDVPPGTTPPVAAPAPFDPESVSQQLRGLLAKDNPLMQQARTTGLQQANRRGLLNSSMAVGAAQNEMLRVALPIASQQAGQAHAKELTAMSLGSQERIASLNVAAHDRQYAISALTELEKKYGAMWTEIVKNNDIPADARENYFQHISSLRDSDLALVEQLYGINIDWASPVATAKKADGTSPSTPSTPASALATAQAGIFGGVISGAGALDDGS